MIADAYVDKAFGTGVVKVTPAHNNNDYRRRPAPWVADDRRDFDAGRHHQRERAQNTAAWTVLSPQGGGGRPGALGLLVETKSTG